MIQQKRNIRFILFLLILIMLGGNGYGQTKQELESKKNKLQKDIDYTNKMLREIKADSKSSYNKLLLINRKIDLRKKLIESINADIKTIDSRIKETDLVIESLESDLKRLKEEYAKMVYFAYKNSNSYDRLMFILSAEDFNQAYKRLKYLQYYSDYRKKQKEIILKTQETLRLKLAELQEKKKEKQTMIADQQEEAVVLSLEKTEQAGVLNELKSKESDLKKQLQAHRKSVEKLQNEIKKIIEEEAKKAAELAKKSPKGFGLTPEEQLISDNFGTNKGRLPWPTERGEITATFGEHEHPIIPGIKIQNNGVDISTTKGSLARALFEGEVRKVLDIPGAGKAVIIRHGNYLTVYQNLEDVLVQNGEKVKAKQNIGKIITKSSDNTTTLHIEIWKENLKLDPALWLAK